MAIDSTAPTPVPSRLGSRSTDSNEGERDEYSAAVAAARDGSRKAMGTLFENCRNYLLLVANSSLGEGLQAKVGASDLVQETFAEAQQIFERFNGDTEQELLRWLTRILENKLGNAAKRYVRTAKRDVSREEPLESEHPSSADAAPLAPTDRPSAQVSAIEERLRIQAVLGELPHDYRIVIRLRIWEGRSFEEVGTQMNRSPDAVRKLFARALIELQTRENR